MVIEGFAFLWFLIVFFIVLAEWGSVRKYSLGVMAGLLVLLSGLYSLVDGIQFKTGEIKQVEYNFLQNITQNITTNYKELQEQTNVTKGNTSEIKFGTEEGTQKGAENITYIYSDITSKPAVLSFTSLIGLVQVLVGIYLILHYGLRLTK